MGVLRLKRNGHTDNGEPIFDAEVETAADLSNAAFKAGWHVYVAAEKKSYVKKIDGTWAELPGATTLNYDANTQVLTVSIG